MQMKYPIWFRLITICTFLLYILTGCCFGERFIYADVFIDYSGFVSDTTYNQYYLGGSFQSDTSLNNPFSGFNSLKGCYLSLEHLDENDSIKVIIELNQTGHRDTFSRGKYQLKGECRTDTYNESVFVNQEQRFGKLISIKP